MNIFDKEKGSAALYLVVIAVLSGLVAYFAFRPAISTSLELTEKEAKQEFTNLENEPKDAPADNTDTDDNKPSSGRVCTSLLEDMKNRGINPEPVNIRSKDIDSYWAEKGYEFQVSEVLLADDIAGAGNWRDNFKIPYKNSFFAVILNVRNTNTETIPYQIVQSIKINDFFRIVDEEGQRGPVSSGYYLPDLQEDGKYMILFAVDKEIEDLQLITGYQYDPDVFNLDFTDGSFTETTGVIKSSRDFKILEKYPLDEFVHTWHKDLLDTGGWENCL